MTYDTLFGTTRRLLRGKPSTVTNLQLPKTKQQEYADKYVQMLWGFLFGLCSCETVICRLEYSLVFKGHSTSFVTVKDETNYLKKSTKRQNFKQ